MISRSRISGAAKKISDLTMKVASTGCHCGGECGCRCSTCSKAGSEQAKARENAEQ